MSSTAEGRVVAWATNIESADEQLRRSVSKRATAVLQRLRATPPAGMPAVVPDANASNPPSNEK